MIIISSSGYSSCKLGSISGIIGMIVDYFRILCYVIIYIYDHNMWSDMILGFER